MSATAPAVRKPAFSLSFGSGSTDDWARSLATVSVEAGLAPAVDVAEVVFSSRDDAPKVALGDTGDVSLGFDDDSPAAVFKGAVRACTTPSSGTTRLVASNGGAVLAAFRLDQGYEQQSAGDIVRDLAEQGRRRPGRGRERPLPPLLRRRQPLERLAARREPRRALRLRGLVRRGRGAPLRAAPGGRPDADVHLRPGHPRARRAGGAAAAGRGDGRRRGRRGQPGQRRLELERARLVAGDRLGGIRRPLGALPARRAPQRGRGERCRAGLRRDGEARRTHGAAARPGRPEGCGRLDDRTSRARPTTR